MGMSERLWWEIATRTRTRVRWCYVRWRQGQGMTRRTHTEDKARTKRDKCNNQLQGITTKDKYESYSRWERYDCSGYINSEWVVSSPGQMTGKEKGGCFDQWVGTILKVKQLISACLASRSMFSVHLVFCLSLSHPSSSYPKQTSRKYRSNSNSFPHLYPLLPSLFLFFFSSLFSSFSLLLGEKLSAETSSRPESCLERRLVGMRRYY